MITKTVKRSEDLYIQFDEQELKTLNIEPKDKFSFHPNEDGTVTIKKFAEIDIDISEWPRELLEILIAESIQKDLSVNDVICNILEEQLPKKINV